MRNEIIKRIFSLSGLSISLGVLGFLSGIVQLFIDMNVQISIKWLLLVLLILISICFILLKFIYDLWNSNINEINQEFPIKYIERDKIFIIKKNENYLNSILVGCYMAEEGVERLIFIGVVHHVQEKVIQIKIIRNLMNGDQTLQPNPQLKDIIIRPVIPFSILSQLEQKEEQND